MNIQCKAVRDGEFKGVKLHTGLVYRFDLTPAEITELTRLGLVEPVALDLPSVRTVLHTALNKMVETREKSNVPVQPDHGPGLQPHHNTGSPGPPETGADG